MPGKGLHALPALLIPHQQLPSAFAAASTSHPRPIGAPGHARDHTLMAKQLPLQRAIRGVPQIHVAIIATPDESRAIRIPCHVTNPGLLPTTQPTLGARRHLPYWHSMQIGSAGQPPTIRTPRDVIEGGVDVVGVLKERHTGSRASVPQPDDIVPRATGQPATIGTPAHPIDDSVMAAQHPGRRPTTIPR